MKGIDSTRIRSRGRWPRGRVLATVMIVIAVMIVNPGSARAASSGPYTLYTTPKTPGFGALYGRAIQLRYSGSSNGVILATHEKGTPSTDRAALPIYRSTDSGVSFTRISDVVDVTNTNEVMYQPMLYELPQAIGSMPAGTILFSANSSPRSSATTQLELFKSTDQGVTWSFVSHIASGGRALAVNGETPVWEPFLMVANNRLIAYYSDQRDPSYGQKLVHQTSTDGVTWGPVVEDVTEPLYDSRPGMAVVTRMGNGKYIMVFEYGGPPMNFLVYYKIATDPEAFAAAPQQLLSASGLTGIGSPYVAYLPNGGNGTVVISTAMSGALWISHDFASPTSWTSMFSRTPMGYSRALVPLADNRRLFGISAGPIYGDGYNVVQYAIDDLGAYSPPEVGTIAAPGGECLGTTGGATLPGTPVELADCASASAGRSWTAPGDGTVRLAGTCLTAAGGGSLTGPVPAMAAPVQVDTCNGAGGQQWVQQNNGALVNSRSGLCLDAPDGVVTAGTRLRIWDCNGSFAQVFLLP